MCTRAHARVCVCVCVKKCVPLDTRLREKKKRGIRDLVVCLSNKSPNVLYITTEFRLSDGGLVTGTSSVRRTGDVVCIT